MDVATKRLLAGQRELSGARLVVASSLLFLFGLAIHRLWALLLGGQWILALVPLAGTVIAVRFGHRHRGLLPTVLLGLAPFLGFVSLETYYALFGTPFVATGAGPGGGAEDGLVQPVMGSFGYPDHLTLGAGLAVVLLGFLLGRLLHSSRGSAGDT